MKKQQTDKNIVNFVAREMWKARYFKEKKKTNPLEEQAAKLRAELEQLHRKIMSHLETTKHLSSKAGDKEPSPQVY